MQNYQKVNQKVVILVVFFSFIPVVIVITQNTLIIVDAVSETKKIDLAHDVLTFCIKLADVMDKIQTERNASIAYLSNNNSLTLEDPNSQNVTVGLHKAYTATDKALEKISSTEWVEHSKEFKMHKKLNAHLHKHRQNLKQGDSIESEFNFYNEINEDLVQQVAKQMRTVDVNNWLDIVSLRMLIEGKEWASRSLVLASIHSKNDSQSAKKFLRFIKHSELPSSLTKTAADVSVRVAKSYHQHMIQDTSFNISQEEGANLHQTIGQALLAHDYIAFLSQMEDVLTKSTQQALADGKDVEGKFMGMAYMIEIVSTLALLVVLAVAKELIDKAKSKTSDLKRASVGLDSKDIAGTQGLLGKAKGKMSDLQTISKVKEHKDVIEPKEHSHRVLGRSSDLDVIPEVKEYKDEDEAKEVTDTDENDDPDFTNKVNGIQSKDDGTQNKPVNFYIGH